ncbi:hypothetical protein KHA94_13985 [Bacillus sp. FJAT-49705]|uniref:Uncharacterized protein n=1 Tax=Cytobacillus citreus TaxID=2833586 RepID=A0ABS5NTX8_9BACI|nr:hypothetical protein [Cytobacillus citreus]MBS4191295.1 hypothetical protein [Cytobacillus citreus]
MKLNTYIPSYRMGKFISSNKEGLEMIPGIWIEGKTYWLTSGTEELMQEEGISVDVEQESSRSDLQSFNINITNHYQQSKNVKLLIQNRYQHQDYNHFSFISPTENAVFHLIDNQVYLIDGFCHGMVREACSVQPIWDIYMDRIWSCSKMGKLKYNPMANGNAASILLYNINFKGIETFEGKTWMIKGRNEVELIKLNEALLKTY